MKNLRNLVMAGAVAALLTGCGTFSRDTAPETATPASRPPAGLAADAATDAAPKIVSLPYRVDLTYSAAARQRLQETSAKMGVSSDYYGAPKDPGAADLDTELGVWLGGEMDVLLAGRASVTMRGEVNATTVARDVDGDVRVRVMAFPVQSPVAANDITCETFDDVLPITVETGAVLHCTLRGE